MIDALEQQLGEKDLTVREFSELCVRLLDNGVLSRDESQIEQQLYDRFVRCEDEARAYFSVLAVRVWHDQTFRFVRLYPPGADTPGETSEDQPEMPGSALRQRMSQNEVAAVLVLRQLYDQGVRDARVDADGAVRVSLSEVSVALQTLLDRNLPEQRTERRALWRRLRQWRLVRWPEGEDPAGTDRDAATDLAVLIRPTIVSLVSDTVLAQLTEPDRPAAEDSARAPENESNRQV